MISIPVKEFIEYYRQNGKHSPIVNSPDFDASRIVQSLTTTISDTASSKGIDINELDIDVENIQSTLPPMNDKEYLEYNQQKRLHHENFLRELKEKGLTLRNQPTDPGHQVPKKQMDY